MDVDDWKPLKIDHAALLRGRTLELHRALEDIWGETTAPIGLGRLEAGFVLWACRNGDAEPVKSARDALVEAASLGLIEKAGGRWRRARGGGRSRG